MIVSAQPIYTVPICGHEVRFFRGPGDKPDMPWHAHEDLLAALGLPRGLRRMLRAKMLKAWGSVCRTVEVDGEPVLLAPHYVAQGLIGAAQEAGQGVTTTPDQVEREYVKGGVQALEVLSAGMSVEDRFRYAMEAFRNQEGGAA